ncbi:hypothetical protein GHT06_003244 [Daphnia sinensis]|uniref:Uncharacterized protein n=1 Tax=Daphnia sinensis TaxID=1820382 RepID=A0AAD5L5D0_9CRUS|nr:hypothetical protein GHT06_003244 [Daphnia sinensis]
MKEKDKTIRLLRQQNARLHSYLNDMSGKIEQFKVELHNLTEKSMEKQICNLKPQMLHHVTFGNIPAFGISHKFLAILFDLLALLELFQHVIGG